MLQEVFNLFENKIRTVLVTDQEFIIKIRDNYEEVDSEDIVNTARILFLEICRLSGRDTIRAFSGEDYELIISNCHKLKFESTKLFDLYNYVTDYHDIERMVLFTVYLLRVNHLRKYGNILKSLVSEEIVRDHVVDLSERDSPETFKLYLQFWKQWLVPYSIYEKKSNCNHCMINVFRPIEEISKITIRPEYSLA